MEATVFQFFGSEDSLDLDFVFFIEEMPKTIQEKLELSKELSYRIFGFSNKKSNANLVVVSNGCLTEVYKGTTDELNNALFYTYDLHEQHFDNQITTLLDRDVDLKFLRSSRMLLSFVSKTDYRLLVKKALKENIFQQLNALEQIDFTTIAHFGKDSNKLDIVKSIAFQIGQSLALNEGRELYTKSGITTHFPDLKPYLHRIENVNYDALQHWFLIYIKALRIRAKSMIHTSEYKYENKK